MRVAQIWAMILDTYMRDKGLTDAGLARQAGVNQSTINRARRGLIDLTVDTALTIERVTQGQVDAATLSSDVRKARLAVLEIRPPAIATLPGDVATPDGADADAEGGIGATCSEPVIECAQCEAPANPACRNRGCPHVGRS